MSKKPKVGVFSKEIRRLLLPARTCVSWTSCRRVLISPEDGKVGVGCWGHIDVSNQQHVLVKTIWHFCRFGPPGDESKIRNPFLVRRQWYDFYSICLFICSFGTCLVRRGDVSHQTNKRSIFLTALTSAHFASADWTTTNDTTRSFKKLELSVAKFNDNSATPPTHNNFEKRQKADN